jgi:hypothetical protein
VLAALLAVACVGVAASLVVLARRPHGPVITPLVMTGTLAPVAPQASVTELLDRQTDALLAGDEVAFLAAVDPAATDTYAAYQALYTNLRGLHVTAWRASATPNARPGLPDGFKVQVDYCLNGTCPAFPTTLEIAVAEATAGRPLIETLLPPARDANTIEPYPWEVAALQFVSGPRVILAADEDEADQLAAALPLAEAAAKVADRFANWGRPPVYVVYLASRRNTYQWFDGFARDDFGEEYQLGPAFQQILIQLPDAATPAPSGPGLQAVIQHEMTHVATLFGSRGLITEDSLVEGIAEYAAYADHPQWATSRLADVQHYVAAGQWSGDCYLTTEFASSDRLTVSAAYGIGYLTVKFLVGRFGLARTLDFWGAVERDGGGTGNAARLDLGVSWSRVNTDCAAYVRSSLKTR